MGLYYVGPTGIRKRRKQVKKRRDTSSAHAFTFAADEVHRNESIANFARTSADGRRQYREQVAVAPPTPDKHAHELVEIDTATQMDEFQHIDLLERQVQEEDEIKPRSRRYVSSVSQIFLPPSWSAGLISVLLLQDEPLKQWIPLRDEYLDELLRLEGRGEFTSPTCPSCVHDAFDVFDDSSTPSPPSIRCQDCFTGELLCEKCCVRLHRQHPLHVIEVSEVSCFKILDYCF
jgi:hypothetical protein